MRPNATCPACVWVMRSSGQVERINHLLAENAELRERIKAIRETGILRDDWPGLSSALDAGEGQVKP
jgi:hypothetical protein